MNPKQFQAAYRRLQALDERYSYKLRPHSIKGTATPTPDSLVKKMQDLAAHSLELREIVDDLFKAIAAKAD